MTIDGVIYNGVALRQWDDGLKRTVMAISVMSASRGTSVWASQLEAKVDVKDAVMAREQGVSPYLTVEKGKVSFYLRQRANAKITAYDLSGRVSVVLWNGLGMPGCNTITFKPDMLRSGIYLYTLNYEGKTVHKYAAYIGE